MNLSPNFTLAEMTHSYTAARHGVSNDITDGPRGDEILANLRALCHDVLEPLRVRLACPVRVYSGYRSPVVNRLVGGARKSDHLDGCAADVVPVGQSPALVWIACRELPWTKRIWEFGDDIDPAWVHLSYRVGVNERLSLRAYRRPGQATRYVPWDLP